MGKGKGKKYGPAGTAFSKQAVAFYNAINASRKTQQGIAKAFPVLGSHGRFAPSPGTINPTPQEKKDRAALREIARQQQAAKQAKGQQNQARANNQGLGPGLGNSGGGVPGARPSGKPQGKPQGPTAQEKQQWANAVRLNQTKAWNDAANGNNYQGKGLDDWLTAAAQHEGLDPASTVPLLRVAALKESSGNPDSINTWDSNAQQGIPSQGLMQTIPSTFYGNAQGINNPNIRNPIHNTIAAIRYARNKYGNRWLQAMAYGANPSVGGGY